MQIQVLVFISEIIFDLTLKQSNFLFLLCYYLQLLKGKDHKNTPELSLSFSAKFRADTSRKLSELFEKNLTVLIFVLFDLWFYVLVNNNYCHVETVS